MKVSIIIPTYNVELYITECLESVTQQTYQGEMECLIVDDCGTDGSIMLAEKFVQSYHGNILFRIIHHEYNRGLSAARNTGVENATGDYVYFLDSDDAIVPGTIEEMVQVVNDYPQVEMVQGGICNMQGDTLSDFTQLKLPDYTDDELWIRQYMFFHLPVTSWNRLLKKDFLDKEDIKFHEGIIHEDVPYCYLLSLKCHHIGFVRMNTYLFRLQREGSITNTPQEERALLSRIVLMKDCIDAYTSQNFSSDEIRNIALSALWKKWINYMTIHSRKILKMHVMQLSNITKRIRSITPWPQKIIVYIYSMLPLRIVHNAKVAKKFTLLIEHY